MNVKNSKSSIYKLVLSAMFIAVGIVLPFITGQVQLVGNMLLPMHLPVIMCGLVCGWQYGGAVGLVLPLIRSLIFGMPPLFPTAVAMAVELELYGLVAGFIFGRLQKKNVLSVYISMLPAMILGRGAWGLIQFLLLGLTGDSFTWQMFFAGAVGNAVPGIVLQLVLVPAVMAVLRYTKALQRLNGDA